MSKKATKITSIFFLVVMILSMIAGVVVFFI